jgi:hypothetical protein
MARAADICARGGVRGVSTSCGLPAPPVAPCGFIAVNVLDAFDLVARGGHRAENRRGVLGPARLECQLDAGLAHL